MPRKSSHRTSLLIVAAEAAALIGISRSKFFELDSAGRVPRAIPLGTRCPRWSVEELKAWIAAGAPERQAWERIKAKSREKLAT